MKKQYCAPRAEKVDFNYEENVLASSTGGSIDVKCGHSCSSGSGHTGGGHTGGGHTGGGHTGGSGYKPFFGFFWCWF